MTNEKAVEILKNKRKYTADNKRGLYDVSVNAIEKQIERKVENIKIYENGIVIGDCPRCKEVVVPPYTRGQIDFQYCQWCGQKMEWIYKKNEVENEETVL